MSPRLRHIAIALRNVPTRTRAAVRRRPRPFAAAALLTILLGLLVAGEFVLLGSKPTIPSPTVATAPTFTYAGTWTLVELQRHIEAGEVAAISATSSQGSGTVVDTLLVKTKDGQIVPIDLSVAAGDAVGALTALGYGNLLTTEAVGIPRPAGVTATANPIFLLIPILGLVLTVLILWRMGRRAAGSARDKATTFTTIMPADPKAPAGGGAPDAVATNPALQVSLADVAGCDEAKLELTETIEFLRSPERFHALGARIPRGIMLFGPPGTGKTMLARAVAAEAGVPFHYASGSEFVEKYVGVGAKRVRDLFAQARRMGRGVIFFDEFDAIGKSRGGPNSHEEREQTLNQLLVELDGFGTTDEVIVIAATNRLDVLDSAVLRPGRFNRKIHVGLPDVAGRKAILGVHAWNKPLAETVDLEELARKTYGFSGAMLADLLNEAAILTARRGATEIEPDDLHNGWLKVAVGTSRRRSMDDRERSIIAAHEVGHAICGKVHGDKRKVEEISLFAHGEALGVTVSSQEDNDLPSESDLRARLVALMGGRAAEEILFHEVTGGASNDFEQANRIATAMVTRWGMGRDPETAEGGVSGRGTLSFLVPTDGRTLPSEVQAAATRAIRGILDQAYATASETLVANMEILRRLAAYLVEHERVDGGTFDELFDGRRPVPNADDEWRAATSRPRDWGEVVDLAARRTQRGASAPLTTEIPAAVAATAPVTAETPAASSPTDAAATAATPSDVLGDAGPVVASVANNPMTETAQPADLSEAPMTSPVTHVPTRRSRRGRVRRTASLRIRHAAAGMLHRAEGWLRPRPTGDGQL